LKKISKNIIIASLSVLCIVLFIYAVIEKTSTDKEYRNLFARNYRIFTPEVPSKIDFAGEKVPLEMEYVKESLDREIMASTFMHSSTILMFKRANRWFPVIEPILKKNGVPDDFKYLAIAESNFGNVVSPSGAEGFWQFLKPTGQKYGLEITEEVDERYNVVKATEAACKYFNEAYAIYHNWTLSAASFNRGMAGMNNAIDGQRAGDFYALWLNDETARYIYRILAIKQVYKHPVQYGYYLREKDFYPLIPTYTISVDTAIANLAVFASKLNTTYRVLREFNPWIQRYNLPNKTGKTYVFLLPKAGMLKVDTLGRSLPQTDNFFNDTLTIQDLH
jgi:membrane-bound lytic murein transglycosylase D